MSFETEYNFPGLQRRSWTQIPFTRVAKIMAFLASAAIVTGMLLQMTGHRMPEGIASPSIAGGGLCFALLYYLSIGKIGSACFDSRRRLLHRLVLGACFGAMLVAISYLLVGYLLSLLLTEHGPEDVYSIGFMIDHLGLTLACIAFVVILDAIVFGANFLELSDSQVQEPEIRLRLDEVEKRNTELEDQCRELENRNSEIERSLTAQIAQLTEEKAAELARIVEVAMGAPNSDLEVFLSLWRLKDPVEARVVKADLGKQKQIQPSLNRLHERGDVERVEAPASYQARFLYRALPARINSSPVPDGGEASIRIQGGLEHDL